MPEPQTLAECAIAYDRLAEAVRAYKSEMENPAKDQTMIQLRRRELFALV